MASKKNKTCLACDRTFRGRSDAKTCSERCRKRMQRVKKSLDKEAQEVKDTAQLLVADVEETLGNLEDKLAPAATQEGFIATSALSQQPTLSNPPPVDVPIPAIEGLETPQAPTNSPGVLNNLSPVNKPQPALEAVPLNDLSQPASAAYHSPGDVFSPEDSGASTLPETPASPSADLSNTASVSPQSVMEGSLTAPTVAEPVKPQSFFHRPTMRFSGTASLAVAFSLVLTPIAIGTYFLSGQVQNRNSSQAEVAPAPQPAAVADNTNDKSLHLNRATYIDFGQPLFANGNVTLQNQKDSATAFQVQNSAGNDVLTVNTASKKVGIDQAPTAAGAALQVAGNISTTGSIQLSSGTALNPANLVINSVTVCTSAGCVPNTTSSLSANQINSGTLLDSVLSKNVALLSANQAFTGNNTFNGKVLFQNSADSNSSFEIQQASGTGDLFVVDTASGKVGIGRTPLPSTNAILQVNGSVDLTGQITFNGNQITTLNLQDSSNIARLDTSQTYTGNNTFSGNIIASTLQASSNLLTIGSLPAQLTLQGNLLSDLTVTDGTHNINVGFSGTPTGDITYNFDASANPGNYTICTTVGNCAGPNGSVSTAGGTAGKLSKFTGPTTLADSSIADNGSVVTVGEPGVFKAGSNSATAFRVQNAGGLIDLLVADTTDSRVGISLSTGNVPQYPLDVAGDINSSTGLRIGGTLVCTVGGCGAGSGSGFYIQNGTATQAANFNVQSTAIGSVAGILQGANGQTADIFNIKDGSGNKVLGVNSTGSTLIQPSINSTSALVVESASPGNNKVLVVDTTTNRVAINQPSASYALDVNGDVNITTGSFFRINGQSICGPQATCAPSAGSSFYIQNGATLQTGANFFISSANINNTTGVLRGALGQVADIMDLQNGSGNNIFTVNATGSILAEASTNSTNAFQIQNAAGTSNLFVADSQSTRIGIGTNAPTASLTIKDNYSSSSPAANLTVSGNEITDATRTTNTQGDGRTPPDSSYGIWEGTTNLLPNGGFESNITGWSAIGAATLTRDTSTSKFGAASGLLSYGGGANFVGYYQDTGSLGSGVTLTASVWLKGTGSIYMRLSGIVSGSPAVVITLTSTWTRYILTGTTTSVGGARLELTSGFGTSAYTANVDGAQIEQKAYTTPYVETNGSTASRSAGIVQAPASLLNSTQGWVAFRTRVGFNSASSPVYPSFFGWGVAANRQISVYYNYASNQWSIERFNVGGGSAARSTTGMSFNAGDLVTVVAYWTGSQIAISVNGSAFTTAPNTSLDTYATPFDIGSNAPFNSTNKEADSDILWSAAGTGTLSNTDAATLNAFGNTDPTVTNLSGSLPSGIPTMAWAANTASYQYQTGVYNPTALQIQDANGNNLLTVNADSSSSSLLALGTNTTTASGGISFGTDTYLYRSATGFLSLQGTSGTSVGLQVAPNIGTDVAGSSLVLSAGQGTGAGNGGSINLQIAKPTFATANQNFITGTTFPQYIATNNSFIYWSSDTINKISRANIDGTGVNSSFITTNDTVPRGVAVDGTYIYWVNATSNTIGRANLDGTGVNQSFITGANLPVGLAINSNFIYWANRGGTTIGRANLDGTGVNQSFITGASTPRGLAIDGSHIYWANIGSNTIGRANLDGTGVNQSFITGLSGLDGLAVDSSYVYWASSVTIGRANLDGTGVNQSFITGLSATAGVTRDSNYFYWSNSVASGSIGRYNFSSATNALSTVVSLSGVNGAATFQNSTNSTTAFQIQNAAGGSNLLVADTTNTRIGIGTAAPTATLSVNGTGLFQAPAIGTQNSLTVSGNEITDATRTTSTQGDGKIPPDSSYGIWEGTTNLVTNGGAESNTTGWGAQNGATLTRDSTHTKFGGSAFKLVKPGTTTFEGMLSSVNIPITSGQSYTISAWVYGNAGDRVILAVNLTNIFTTVNLPVTGWNYVRASGVGTSTGANGQYNIEGDGSPQATTWWVDGVQVEQKAFATPYVETNGATASRASARVQGSITASNLSSTQGWVAMRVRMPNSPAAYSGFGSNSPRFWSWGSGFQDYQVAIQTNYTGTIAFTRNNGRPGAASVNSSIAWANPGDLITIVAAWDANGIYLSTNGSNFVTGAGTGIPPSLPNTFDIGSLQGSVPSDADYMWFAAGTGTLTNTDATNINAFGNTDPNTGSFSGTAASAFVWQANNATYQYPGFQPISFQVQNSSGSQLLGVDANASAVLLPSATSSTAALIFGGDSNANLYRSAASTLTTSATFQSVAGLQAPSLDTLTVGTLSLGTTNATAINLNQNTTVATGKSFTAGGTALFKNSVDSTGAFAIQNAAGTSNLFAADTTDSRLGVATATPLTTFNVSGSVLLQGTSNSANNLTLSGNEITDATRTVNQQGDGITPPDSSYGIWEGTTNLVTNGGFESNTTGWGGVTGSGIALTRVANISKFGSASLQAVTDGTNQNGPVFVLSGLSGSTTYTWSIWIKGSAGVTVKPQIDWSTSGGTFISSTTTSAVTLTSSWQQLTLTGTSPSNAAKANPTVFTSSPVATTFYVDGAQFEQKPIATPYVETNGATASRSAARVQGPSTNTLSSAQGWVAVRARMGATSTGTNQALFSWTDGSPSNYFYGYYSSNAVITQLHDASGSYDNATANYTGAVGNLVTAIFAWTSTNVMVSVNGSSFTTISRTRTPASLISTIEFGSINNSQQWDGDILWTSTGTGTLTNTDAANINNFGNTDPYTTNFAQAAYPTMVWHANNGTYQTGTSLALQVQNSSGANLLAVDSANTSLKVGASTKLQNLVDSTNAFTVNTLQGATLFNVNTSNLQVSTANLQSGGSVNIVNSQGSISLAPGISSPNSLTVSGNEITDIERAEGASGTNVVSHSYDGKTNDSSYGLWEGTTNLILNGGAETNTSNTNFWGPAGTTITRDTTTSKFGSASFKAVTNSGGVNQGLTLLGTAPGGRIPVTGSTTYTFSVWLKGNTGGEAVSIGMGWYDSGQISISGTGQAITLTNGWARYSFTATSPSNAAFVYDNVSTQGSATLTWFSDGAQFEQKAIATPYVETNGAAATRGAAIVQAPPSNLNVTQGWVAVRLRPEWVGQPSGTVLNLFSWGGAGNQIQAFYRVSTGTIELRRDNGSFTTDVVSKSITNGTPVTAVFAWDSGNLYVSLDGGSFTPIANTNIPTIAAAVLIGSNSGIAQIDSEILWTAMGTGTLTTNDASTLNNFGNTDPTLAKLYNLNSGAGAPSFVWNGNATAYQDTTSSNGQALIYAANTSSILTGNLIDLQSGAVPASKFNVDTSGNTVLAGSLSVGGLSTFTGSTLKTVSDSAGAFQFQNASGNTLFNIDSTNSQISLGAASATTPTTLVLGTKTTVGDPASPTNGEIYYNSALNAFRCYQAGVWVNCTGAGGGGGGGGDVNQGGNTFGAGMVLGTNDNFALSLRTNAVNVMTLGTNGSALFQNSADSTTAFQIQNLAGTSNLLVADTTNSRIGIGTATPTATLGVNGSGLFQQSTVTNLLTVSGNEITDTARTANTQGDGQAAPDSSYGIWEGTTNGLKNGGLEGGTTSWQGSGTGALSINQDTAKAKFGTHSLNVTVDGTVSNQGAVGGVTDGPTAASGQTWTASAWVWAPTGANMQAFLAGRDSSNVLVEQTLVTFTGTGAWQRIAITRTLNNATTTHVSVSVTTNTATAMTFWVDGAQLEQKAYATPYVETNGSTASRNAARVQAPIGSMNTTQGWMAMRVRLDFPSTAQPGNPTIFGSLAIDNNNRLQIAWQGIPGTAWGTRRVLGGVQGNSATISDSFNAGDFRTLILKWDSGNIGLSVNGSNFVTVANSQTFTPTSFDIGSNIGGIPSDSDYMWFAAGTGTLGSADASNINAFGNTDPSLSSFPGGATTTMVWQANTATYQNSANQSAVLSVQNSSGVNLLNVNADSASLTAGTSALFKNASNSTNAFQVQNASSMNVFGVDTANGLVNLGTPGASGVNGQIVLNSTNAGGYGVTIKTTSALAASYTLKLPTAAPTTGQCVQVDAIDAAQLDFVTCSGGGAAVDLQGAYNNSTNPATIATTSAAKGIIFKAGVSNDSTTLFQVQNSSGLDVFNTDTLNKRVGINVSAPLAALQVNGTGLVLGASSAATSLTLSGNEMTDAARAQNYQGDGRANPDSSVGIWEGTTNLVTNGGFESNTTGWSSSDGVATLSRDTSVSKIGAASLKVVAPTSDGIRTTGISATSGTQYTESIWVNAPNGASMVFQWVRADFNTVVGATNFTGTGAWQRVTLTVNAPATETEYLFVKGATVGVANTFWVDGAQIEQKAIATPYVETNGATASRSAARVQAPATGSLGATQGWVSARVRMSGAYSARTQTAYLFNWSDGTTNNQILVRWSTGPSWVLEYHGGGVVNANALTATGSTFADGDFMTVTAAWTASTIGISVNGGAFTTVARTVSDASGLSSLFDIGSVGGTFHLDGDVLWTASGTGTLTNTDASNINSFGNTDPYITSFSRDAYAALAWHANTAAYQTGNTLAFQVQNNNGANLFNINSDSSSLTAGISAKFQNLTDSTTAFQIQNATGQSNLFVVDTADSRLGVGTATPVATVNVIGSTLIQQGNNTNLTVSGNEITDASRATNTQGDGRAAPDSSEGIWEGTTNLVANGGFETSLNAGTTWFDNGSGSTLNRITTDAKFGSASLQVTNASSGTGASAGVSSAVVAGSPVTGSAWLKATTGSSLTLGVSERTGADVFVSNHSQVVTATGLWQRVSVTYTPTAGNTLARVNVSGPQGVALGVDGAQLEQKAVATPYVETNGATASRSAAAVQAPATNLNAAQGWVALRFRPGWSSASPPSAGSGFPILWTWMTDSNNRLSIIYGESTRQFFMDRRTAGLAHSAASSAQTFNAGDTETIVAYWTPTSVAVSINGGSFTTLSDSTALTPSGSTFFIGSLGINNSPSDSDILWTATGTGTLSNNDAASLNGFGNTDPTFTQLPANGTPTFLWKANTANYINSTNADIVFQANNNQGSSLLSLDSTNAKLSVSTAGLFQNVTNSSNALAVNTASGTQLFNVNTSNLQVTSSNLQSSGAVNLTNVNGAVSLAGSLQSTSTLTTSGNEITDTSRTTNTQGDGKIPPDSSYGIWENTTNLVVNGGFESNTTGWGKASVGQTETLARDQTHTKFGSWALKVTTDAAQTEGTNVSSAISALSACANGTTCTFSSWVWVPTGMTLNVRVKDSGFVIVGTNQVVTGSNSWVRVITTITGTANTATTTNFYFETSQADSFWIDGTQEELKPIATPYVETNGATASRNAARVQASATNLNATQGWAAVRVKMGFPSTATSSIIGAGGGTSLTLFSWQNDNNNRIVLTLDTNNQFNTVRQSGGATVNNASSSPQTWNTDDTFMVVAEWDANSVYLSVNGSAFSKISNTSIPTLTNSLFDIGRRSDPAVSGWIDSNILWTVTGTGTLTNTDATTLNGLGNTDPTLAKLYSLNTGAGQPTFVWNANSANFQDTTSSNGQALIYAANTSGATTGNLIDLQSGTYPSSRFSIDVTGKTTIQTSTNSTTAFQIQNASGASLLTADTLNGQIGIGTTTPTATLTVNGTGLIQASSASNPLLTVSGNEITDASRATNTQGDGRTPPDSSEGIWEGTTNLMPNGGAESNINGWAGNNSSTISRDITKSKFGNASVKVITPGVLTFEGTVGSQATVSPSTTYTASMWVFATAGATLRFQNDERNTSNGTVLVNNAQNFTAAGGWQRVTMTFTTSSTTNFLTPCMFTITTAQAITFWIDGVQVEQKTFATPYVETNGSTASRTAASVTAPASNLNANQGWFAIRLRMGAPQTSSTFQAYASWSNGLGQPRLTLANNTPSGFRMQRSNGTTTPQAIINASYNAGDFVTLIGTWGGGQLGISVNGSVFTTVTDSLGSLSIPTSSFTIGTGDQNIFGPNTMDGDAMWVASGTGTLTNSDASNINSFGNTDPGFSSFPGLSAPTMVWQANNSGYINNSSISPIVFNVQNSLGSSLFNVDASLSSVNLQNATNSTAALILGNDANLYRNAAGTLKTDTNLTVGNNLAVNGAGTFKNVIDSTSAVQIQNAAGTSNLFVADTTNTRIGIGTATPTATLSVVGTGLFQASSASNPLLTVSGNEMTDANRTTNTQGDGRTPPDSSEGIWEGTTNLLRNGGTESNTTNWNGVQSDETVTRDTSIFKFGSASVKVSAPGIQASEGLVQATAAGQAWATGTVITHSAWIKAGSAGDVGKVVQFIPRINNTDLSNTDGTGVNVTLTNSWQYVSGPVTVAAGKTGDSARWTLRDIGSTFAWSAFVDGAQVEQKALATPYVETNGSTATRNVSRVQAPSSLVNSTQGWVAMRVRMPYSPSAYSSFASNPPRFWSWGTTFQDFQLYIQTSYSGSIGFSRNSGRAGAASVSSPIAWANPGDLITIVAAWDASGVYISTNGSTFTTASGSGIPPSLPPTFDIGTLNGANWADSDTLWTATGTGTLTNTDAGNINGFGNTDPSFSSFPGLSAPTMVWQANNSSYINSSSSSTLTLNVQNSGGASLLNVDSNLGSVNLQNAVSSTSALVLGNDANLYRSAASTIKTDGNLAIANNLTANGNIKFQTTNNSTTALLLQNSAGTNLLAADTINMRLGIGAAPSVATTAATLQVSGTSSVQQTTAASALTVSGNEITDVSRAASSQGDGRATPDSSYGIWEATTNLVTNGGVETNNTGWTSGGSNTATRDTSRAKFGVASLKATYQNNIQLALFNNISVTNGQTYTASAWVYVPVSYNGTQPQLEIGSGATAIPLGARNVWQRVTATFTAAGSTVNLGLIERGSVSTAGQSIWLDGVQVENKSVATPYVETNGAPAARGNSRVQAPSTLLNQTQGWFAARVRVGFAAGGAPSGFQDVMTWNDGSINNGLQLIYRSADKTWRMRIITGGSSLGDATSAVQNFSAGDTLTIIGYWTPTQAAISVNGSGFVILGLTLPTFTNLPNLFDIGSQLGSSGQFDGDILWTASGTGTLSSGDASAINSLGNADPDITFFNAQDASSTPTMVWKANNANYQDKLAFSVQNNIGAGLLNIDAADGSVLLANATSSAGALVLGRDANLYRSGAGILKTDGSLAVGTNLTVSGSTLLQNAVNSTTALQINNASGSNILAINTVNDTVGIGTNGSTTTDKLYISTASLVGLTVNQTGAGNLLQLQNNGTNVASIGATGSTVFQNSANSTSAFQIQNLGGTTLLGVDTTNSRIFSTQADGASAIGFEFNTLAYGTAGAKLLSVQNNAVEKFAVDKDGNVNIASGAQYKINGNQIATSDLANGANVALLNGTGPQTFTGNNKFTGGLLFQNASDSGAAVQIQNAAGTSNLFVADTTHTRLAVAQASAGYTLDVGGDINTTGILRVGGIQISTASLSDGFNIGLLNANNNFSGINTFSGNTLFKPVVNSTTALQIQGSTGNILLVADTTNMRLYVGNPAGDTTGTLFVLSNKTTSGDPAGTNGSMYYNASSGKFRCYENGNWQNCLFGAVTNVKSSDQAISSTSYGDITDLGFAVGANRNYLLQCSLLTSVTGNGGNISMDGPASPNSYTATFMKTSDQSAGDQFATSNTYNDPNSNVSFQVVTSTTGSNQFVLVYNAILKNGANAGTWKVVAKAVSGGTITFYGGSVCDLRPF